MLAVTQLSGFGITSEDLYWNNTTSLFHFDGSNGSTTFTDNSKYNLTATAFVSAQISTTQSKFGGSSFSITPGGGARLEVAYNNSRVLDFGTGNFTIDFWVYRNATGTRHYILDTRYNNGFPNGIGIRIENTNVISIANSNTNIVQSVSTINASQWYHIAVSREGTTLRLFIDGTLDNSVTDNTSFRQNDSENKFIIGASGFALGNVPLNGYLDELRIIKGTAAYTSNFTPPTSAYANP